MKNDSIPAKKEVSTRTRAVNYSSLYFRQTFFLFCINSTTCNVHLQAPVISCFKNGRLGRTMYHIQSQPQTYCLKLRICSKKKISLPTCIPTYMSTYNLSQVLAYIALTWLLTLHTKKTWMSKTWSFEACESPFEQNSLRSKGMKLFCPMAWGFVF